MFVVDLCLTSLWLEFAGFWWELRFVRRDQRKQICRPLPASRLDRGLDVDDKVDMR